MSKTRGTYRIASYNVENMKKMFHGTKLKKAAEKKLETQAAILHNLDADIIGIIEASNNDAHYDYFLRRNPLAKFNYQLAKSSIDRGNQDLFFFYRDPFEVVSIDDNIEFYDAWYEDIDSDGITESLMFERKPLEVLFRDKENNNELLIILVSFKSKGVFSAVDFYKYEHLALANRKKLYAQSKKLRERIEMIMKLTPDLPFIVMGDINDEIGLDSFQKILGVSAVETIMGSIFKPEQLMHNALWHLIEENGIKNVWSAEFIDPIVGKDRKQKSLIDHIFIPPAMLNQNSAVKFVRNSGNIFNEKITQGASDHLPVYCEIEIN